MLKAVIVDDELYAREELNELLIVTGEVDTVALCSNAIEGIKAINTYKPDLVFLDIQMPELKGTDFAEIIAKSKSKIVFTTAYSEYALEGFELSALDYLLKPITFKRFLKAVEKFPHSGEKENEHIIIKSGYDLHKIAAEDILYIESDSEYVRYHLESGKKIMANQSLSKLIAKLPDSFLQVHRSYIVNGEKVTGLKGRELLLGEIKIPVSDTYFEKVKKELFG